MTATLHEEQTGQVVTIELTGKLTKEDYKRFVPRIEALIGEHGKLRLLVEMRDFHGWEMAALWEDIKFDMKHFGDIERLAMVGDRKWEKGMAGFCKPFTKAEIRYFDRTEKDQALEWLNEAG